MVDIMLLELVADPSPSAENDVSGFTWRRFSVLELKAAG